MVSTFLKSTIVIVLAGVVTIIVLYDLGLDKCPIQQIEITDSIKKFDQTKYPELCSQLNEKISQFDVQCSGDIEELDCG